MEKISVVVPIYNVEKYLNRCIESILNQSYKNLEILLIDDGSTDDSFSICEIYSEKDSRIKLFKKKNGGLSDARNYGIERSTGNFITFIDSDDYIDINYIYILYNNLKKNKSDISICSFDYTYTDNSFCKKYNKNFILMDNIEILKKMYSFENDYIVSLVTAWGKLYKKELFSNIRYPIGKYYEDEFTTYKIYIESKKIVYINDKLYFYRIRDNSIMSQNYSLKNLDSLEAIRERINYLKLRNFDVLETKYFFANLLAYNMYKIRTTLYKKDILYDLKLEYKYIYNDIFFKLKFKRKFKLFILKYFSIYYYKFFNKKKGNSR